jgi:hypothetical protein
MQMTEFETRLLRLVGLGIVTLGSVGLVIARIGEFFTVLACVGMLLIVVELLPDLVTWLRAVRARIKERWTNEWRDQLAAPARAERDATHTP